jgi:hypothetical protein
VRLRLGGLHDARELDGDEGPAQSGYLLLGSAVTGGPNSAERFDDWPSTTVGASGPCPHCDESVEYTLGRRKNAAGDTAYYLQRPRRRLAKVLGVSVAELGF